MYEKTGRLPEALIAFVGGGSSAMGLFYPFLQDDSVRLYGVEAGGTGIDTAAYAYLKDMGRIEYVAINDDDAVAAFRTLSRVEGIIPALEPSYAIAYAMKLARDMSNQEQMIVNLSARSDKDIYTVANLDGMTLG
jgi:tryptophan synthase beta chain